MVITLTITRRIREGLWPMTSTVGVLAAMSVATSAGAELCSVHYCFSAAETEMVRRTGSTEGFSERSALCTNLEAHLEDIPHSRETCCRQEDSLCENTLP